MPAGEEPITALCGEVSDQAALYGLLNQLFDLRLTILSVVRLEGAWAGDFTRPTGSPRSP